MELKTRNPKAIFQVFLANDQNEIFVCKPNGKFFNSENICAEGKSMNEAIINIEDKWGILCMTGNLEEIFCAEQLKDSENICVYGYILKIKLNKEISELLEEKSHCEFIEYRSLIEIINNYHIKSNLNESILALIAKIEYEQKVYNY